DLGGAGDAEGDAGGVLAGEVVGHADPAGAEADAAFGAVGELDADRGDVAKVEEGALVLGAGAGQPGAAERRWREGGLEQDAARLPLVDVVALHDAVPAAHLLL